jgi:DNA repair protein RecO (recombination protein O)
VRWTDDGIFLTGRPHGETSVIADIFTRENGRTMGLVKGGRSRRIRPSLQIGNALKVEWRARLDEQLGVFTVELAEAIAARALDDELALTGVMAVTALLRVLPERDPHPSLFDVALACLRAAGSEEFTAAIVRFELRFLDELGFGLDLSKCAATGRTDDLVFVSPKSGQAVSRDAGEPFRDKLLPLPSFLARDAKAGAPSQSELADGLAMTGYFLSAHVFGETGRPMPHAREQFARLVRRPSRA